MERTLDCLEKVFFLFKDYKPTVLSEHFYEFASEETKQRVSPAVLELVINKYWRPMRSEKKWHTFMRKFWENPDYNDPDITVAFRKRSEKEKIKTRPKLKIHQDRLIKGEKVKEQTIKVVLNRLIPDLFAREAQKQSLAKINDAKFDLEFKALLKEKGIKPVLSK